MNVRNYRVYIEDQEALEAFVERARRSSVLAIDTEFLREKTYYARLCLIQFATDDEVAVVDPFGIKDLHVLAPLLEDAGVMKVLHSGGQDLEILWHEVGVLPQPLSHAEVLETAERAFSPDSIGKFLLRLSGREPVNEILHDAVLMNLILGRKAKKPLWRIFHFSGKSFVFRRHISHQWIGKINGLAGLFVPEDREDLACFFDCLNALF